jgi:hypothetical protein
VRYCIQPAEPFLMPLITRDKKWDQKRDQTMPKHAKTGPFIGPILVVNY